MNKLLSRIRRHEGFKKYAYTDTVGKLTIGYGRNIDERGGLGITPEEADIMLHNDICRCGKRLQMFHWFNALDKVRQEALIELSYNMGLTNLLTFRKMIAALTNKEFRKARNELLDSKWATQVQLTRSKDIAYRLLFGRYQND